MNKEELVEFGRRIRVKRVEQGISQQELADRLFVSRQSVSNYERGKFPQDPEIIERIAEELRIMVPGADVNAGNMISDVYEEPVILQATEQECADNSRNMLFKYTGLLMLFLLLWVLCSLNYYSVVVSNVIYVDYFVSAVAKLIFRPCLAVLSGWTFTDIMIRHRIWRAKQLDFRKRQIIILSVGMMISVWVVNLINCFPLFLWDYAILFGRKSSISLLAQYHILNARKALFGHLATSVFVGLIRYGAGGYLLAGGLLAFLKNVNHE